MRAPTPTPTRLLLAALVALALPGCRSLRVEPPPPVPAEASRAFAVARTELRRDDEAGRAAARAAAEEALRLAPGWVAPRRLLDDLARAELLGVESLAAYRATLQSDPADAGALYLAGRLEGAASQRFEDAARADASLAWAWHGLAYTAERRGDLDAARAHELRALALARDSWERSFFTSSLARIDEAAEDPEGAVDRLVRRLEEPEVEVADWIQLSVQLAQVELAMLFRPEARAGWERALALLREHDLTEAEVHALVDRLRLIAAMEDPSGLELQLALAARPGAVRDRLRAELMLLQRPTPLALGLLRRAQETDGRPGAGGPLMRRARFAAGLYAEGVEAWLAELPSFVRREDGLPRDAALRRVVESTRALDTARTGAPSPDALVALGEALVAAGWFTEARSVASVLASHDLERALELEARGASGLELLQGVETLMRGIDVGQSAVMKLSGDPHDGAVTWRGSVPPGDLDGLLDRLAELFGRAAATLDLDGDRAAIAREVRASPRIGYGFVGALVHPGPTWSESDAHAGLGPRAAEVPGLARALARIGRFGVFGQVLGGGGPDATVLQRLHVEVRSGEHLGVPWSGTIAWCEGADVLSRAGRAGAQISGAAVHEGYWVDLDRVRAEYTAWREFERRFLDPAQGARLERALATGGLELESATAAERRRERRAVQPLLGSSELLRLAILSDRRALAGRVDGVEAADLVPFEELARLTAIHEEGHLCDRTRFLPLSRHWPRVVKYFASSGFSPRRAAERLEHRAQLVTVCVAPDPRVPLVEILRATELGNGVTPHAAGYRRILEDLLALLDEELARRPDDWPELDPGRMLVHQLHRIGPGRLRQLALRLAEDEGLTRR